MQRTGRRLRSLAAATALLVAPVGCATLVGGPQIPDLGGEYTGSIEIQGQSIAGTLYLEQDGDEFPVVVFDAPGLGLAAEGEGTVSPDGTFTVSLAYDLQCPGIAELSGSRAGDGSLSGTLAAGDCTGDVSGSFRFEPS